MGLPSFSEIITSDEGRKYLVSLDISPDVIKPDRLIVNRLFVPPPVRRQGHAKRVMAKLCAWCDEKQYQACLVINSYGEMSYDQLTDFYATFGFLTVDGVFYVRKPKGCE